MKILSIHIAVAATLALMAGGRAAYAQPPAFYRSVDLGFIDQVSAAATGKTPRLPNGKPDLTGYWSSPIASGAVNFPAGTPGVRFEERVNGSGNADQAMMNRGRTNRPLYKPEYWEKVQALDFSKIEEDPQFRGKRQGVPRQGPPQWIVQSPQWIATYAGLYRNEVRFIPTDGRQITADEMEFGDTDMGIGVGRWEGDTLIIELDGFNDRTWLYWTGYLHSADMTVTERLTRRGNMLIYEVTVTDPVMLQEPWVLDTNVRFLNVKGERPEEMPDYIEQDLEFMPDPYYRG